MIKKLLCFLFGHKYVTWMYKPTDLYCTRCGHLIRNAEKEFWRT